MSDSYSTIAEVYEYIFPLNPLQLDFIKSNVDASASTPSLLDLGCGTGSLADALSRENYNIVGIDRDKKMIEVAQNRTKGKPNVTFLVEDMNKIHRSFKAETFDAIYSFGNSIVHLGDSESIENLFQSVKGLLKPNGKFIGQIINYRRIFDKMVTGLPTIDNEHVVFERGYQFTGPGEPLIFKTRALIKSAKKIVENEETLYPLLPEEALFFLESAGFQEIELFGAFNKDALLADSYSFIFVAR